MTEIETKPFAKWLAGYRPVEQAVWKIVAIMNEEILPALEELCALEGLSAADIKRIERQRRRWLGIRDAVIIDRSRRKSRSRQATEGQQ